MPSTNSRDNTEVTSALFLSRKIKKNNSRVLAWGLAGACVTALLLISGWLLVFYGGKLFPNNTTSDSIDSTLFLTSNIGDSAYCLIKIDDIDILTDKAYVSLSIDWRKNVPPLEDGEVMLAFLIAFDPIPVHREYLWHDVKYSGGELGNLISIESKVKIQDLIGKTHEGMLLLFCTVSDSTTDLQKSGVFSFPLFHYIGHYGIDGKCYLSAAIFLENDPELDLFISLFKKDYHKINKIDSLKYKQLSNTVIKSINLN